MASQLQGEQGIQPRGMACVKLEPWELGVESGCWLPSAPVPPLHYPSRLESRAGTSQSWPPLGMDRRQPGALPRVPCVPIWGLLLHAGAAQGPPSSQQPPPRGSESRSS